MDMNNFKEFSRLHHESTPLLLGNIWDIHSALAYERAGYKAIGTSSMAVAQAWGFDDGENMPFNTLLHLVKRVKAVTRIPLTVDVEGGYSRTIAGIVENIKQLSDLGVAGINLEDTIPAATRQLRPVAEFQTLLAGIAEALSRNNISIFLNARTDGFLLGHPNALSESLTRIKAYEQAGAHGIFVPGVTATNDIQQVVQATTLPINVMCMPSLPDYKALTSLGVKRISLGPFVQSYVHKQTEAAIAAIGTDGNFSSLFR
jgi:2-methylisocitrate lyase-like PEP mutase family enzyme